MKKYLEVYGWPRRSHSWNRHAIFIYDVTFSKLQLGFLEKVAYFHIHFCIYATRHKSSNKKRSKKNRKIHRKHLRILTSTHSYIFLYISIYFYIFLYISLYLHIFLYFYIQYTSQKPSKITRILNFLISLYSI